MLKEKDLQNEKTETHILIPISLIKSTPNNIELGEKIRKLFYYSQNDEINDIYNKE
jgi:hypothetical protein